MLISVLSVPIRIPLISKHYVVKLEFTIVTLTYYKPWIAVVILDL